MNRRERRAKSKSKLDSKVIPKLERMRTTPIERKELIAFWEKVREQPLVSKVSK